MPAGGTTSSGTVRTVLFRPHYCRRETQNGLNPSRVIIFALALFFLENLWWCSLYSNASVRWIAGTPAATCGASWWWTTQDAETRHGSRGYGGSCRGYPGSCFRIVVIDTLHWARMRCGGQPLQSSIVTAHETFRILQRLADTVVVGR